MQPVIVLGDTAVAQSSVAAGQPGDGPFDHRPTLTVFGQPIRVTKAGALGLAACGRRGQHRTGEVENVGKPGDRLVIALIDKPVAQSTRISSSERASNGSLGESWIGQGGEMNGFGPGLVGEQARGPELSGAGAGLKLRVEIGGGSQPACGDDG